ncbi:MAG: ABC transporter permease [Clostridiales bacterium]|nr:ABC transporter permease [Clostridiales bacterium]MDD6935912.1 ABC transporter permease [Clostridiales bacterium]MDY2960715.1 ABC transporter permease [Oscillospiraceae bacterium]
MNIAAYFASLSLPNLVSRLPGGVAQGIIWGIMALGVYITFRLLDVADLTVDGSFTTGGAVTAMLILAGWPAWAALLVAVLAGLLAGLVTGLLHTKLGIPAILAGILTQFALYSINLRIMGMSANKPVNPDRYRLLLTLRHIPSAILVGLILAAVLIAILYWYFGTEQGSALRATGSNPAMSRAQGININTMKVLGLSLSNGVVALSGGLMAQYQGFADINMGRGAIVIGLAAVIIGEVLCDAIFRKGCSFHTRLSFVVLGGVVYYIVMVVILWLRLDSNDLKLFTAVLVAVFLAVPYLQAQRRSSFKLAGKRSALTQGGQKGAQ